MFLAFAWLVRVAEGLSERAEKGESAQQTYGSGTILAFLWAWWSSTAALGLSRGAGETGTSGVRELCR